MENNNNTQVIKDLSEKSITVIREFKAALPNVWRACTESTLLDQWWGPQPCHVESKSMNFTVGGTWLYAMVCPGYDKHWACMKYTAIDNHKSFEMTVGFCDELGNISLKPAASAGRMSFNETANSTRLEFKMTFADEADLMKIIEMGFEQGITICMEQLGQLFAERKI